MPCHQPLERVFVSLTHPFDQLERGVEGTIVGHVRLPAVGRYWPVRRRFYRDGFARSSGRLLRVVFMKWDPGMTHILFVDGRVVSSAQDGSLNNPFKKIQAAVDVVNASVAEVLAEFPIGSGDGAIKGGVRHFPIPPTVADSVQDWMILIAPGDYDEDLAISGPVRLALIGLGGFRLGRYTSQGLTQPGPPLQTNIVAEDGRTRNLVWTYTSDQAIQLGATPQLVIGTIGGTDVVRHGKPIANRISGSIIVQGGGWTRGNAPAGGTAYLAIANTQVDAGITKSQPAPMQPAIDTTGSTFERRPHFAPLAPFSATRSLLFDNNIP